MANVLGTLFGDIANAIRSKTGDTAKMKPIDFPTKILGIEVGGATTVDIIPEQELTFVYDESAGVYSLGGHNLFNITSIALGKEYKVVWGSDEYSCTAVEGLFSGQYPMIGIGNPYVIGGENNNLPFAIGYIPVPDYGSQYTCIIASLDGSATKNVRVYQEASGGGNIIVNSGEITPTDDKQIYTIEHGLGVVPDLIIVNIGLMIPASEMPNYSYVIYGGHSFSNAILEKIPSDISSGFNSWWVWAGGDFGFMPVAGGGLDSTNSAIWGHIRNGNASTFQVGGSTYAYMLADYKYRWYALAGLL